MNPAGSQSLGFGVQGLFKEAWFGGGLFTSKAIRQRGAGQEEPRGAPWGDPVAVGSQPGPGNNCILVLRMEGLGFRV